MDKIKNIRLKAQIVEEIINDYSFKVDCCNDLIANYTKKLETCEEIDKSYYKREISELEGKIKAIQEISSHLEKLF